MILIIKHMNELRNYILKNPISLSGTNKKNIIDLDSRVINNLKEFGKFEIPENIKTIYDLLIYCDEKNGVCDFHGCNNKKKLRCGRKWVLNQFCSRKCSSLWFSEKQKLDNTCKKMTSDSMKSMREKLSIIVSEKIKSGTFTPGVTNSWCYSKIEVLINDKIVKVRSSWEALFYIVNPNLLYEKIRIEYFDSVKNKKRIYLVDFCDPIEKILYEIKPTKGEKLFENKKQKAEEWCLNNGYSFVCISEEWVIQNYKKNLLQGQPQIEKISSKLEKMIKNSTK